MNNLNEERMDNELNRLRKEVHYYLDSLWLFSSNKSKSRSNLYKWLSVQMDLTIYETHVRFFNRDQCLQALRILKPRYYQYYGKHNISKTEKTLYDKLTLEYKRRNKK